jgi:hypothetical protein
LSTINPTYPDLGVFPEKAELIKEFHVVYTSRKFIDMKKNIMLKESILSQINVAYIPILYIFQDLVYYYPPIHV